MTLADFSPEDLRASRTLTQEQVDVAAAAHDLDDLLPSERASQS